MSDYENLRVAHDGGVALVTIDSTSRMNALNRTMADELLEVAIALAEDDGVRAIALTAEANAFSAGADLGAFEGGPADGETLRLLASLLHDAVIQLHQAEAPVVTGVNGVAAGAGFSLAILGDVVIASEDARFDFAYDRIGLTGDGGSTYFLPRLVGARTAKQIVLLEDGIGPDRAVELGLATEVVPADELSDRLDAVASDLASGPTKALSRTTRLIDESFDRGIEAQLAAETEAMARSTHTEDYARGFAAFFGDEPPEFTGS